MSQFKLVNDYLIGWVPSNKCTNNESIEENTISRSIVVLSQGCIFLLLFLSSAGKSAYLFSNDIVTSIMATVLQVSLTAIKSGRREPSSPGTDVLILTVVYAEALKALTSLS